MQTSDFKKTIYAINNPLYGADYLRETNIPLCFMCLLQVYDTGHGYLKDDHIDGR